MPDNTIPTDPREMLVQAQSRSSQIERDIVNIRSAQTDATKQDQFRLINLQDALNSAPSSEKTRIANEIQQIRTRLEQTNLPFETQIKTLVNEQNTYVREVRRNITSQRNQIESTFNQSKAEEARLLELRNSLPHNSPEREAASQQYEAAVNTRRQAEREKILFDNRSSDLIRTLEVTSENFEIESRAIQQEYYPFGTTNTYGAQDETQIKELQQQSPDALVWDNNTSSMVNVNSIEYDPNFPERYSIVRDTTQITLDRQEQLQTLNNYDNQIKSLEDQRSQNIAAQNEKTRRLNEIENLLKDPKLNDLTRNELEVEQDNLQDDITNLQIEGSSLDGLIQTTSNDKQTAETTINRNIAINNQPVTIPEAFSARDMYYIANETLKNQESEIRLRIERAKRECQSNNLNNDCNKPENWAPDQKAAIDALNNSINLSKIELSNNAERLAELSLLQNGEAALLEAGLTPEEIQRIRDEAEANRTRDPNAIDQSSNYATDTNDANVGRRPTGFEAINNGAPFYFQFPTLKALSDFRIKNGYSPYGARDPEAIARDAVHFTLYDLNPPTPTATTNSDGTLVKNNLSPSSINMIGSFTIYPNDPNWLNLSHRHTWEDQHKTIAEVANTTLGVVDTLQALTEVGSSLAEGAAAGREQAIAQRVSRRIDTVDTYKSSEKLSLSIPFKLFTKNDFLNDIFRPLMLLTAMTYPKRLVDGGTGAALEKVVGAVKGLYEKLLGGDAPNQNIINNLNSAGQTIREKVSEFENKLASTGGFGPFRYYIEKRPEYMTMRHASGLVYFPMAYIESIKYEFEGPWYNYDGEQFNNPANVGKIESIISTAIRGNSLFDSNISVNDNIENAWRKVREDVGRSIDDVRNLFPRTGSSTASNRSSQNQNAGTVNEFIGRAGDQRKMLYAYPSTASVSITVKNALPMYRDDFMEMFLSAGQSGQELVNVSVRNTGQGNLIRPDGTIRPLTGITDTQGNSLFTSGPSTISQNTTIAGQGNATVANPQRGPSGKIER